MIIIDIAVAGGVLFLLFKPIFGDADGFWECVRFWFTPNIVSWFQEEYYEDLVSTFKLHAWLGCGVLAGAVVHVALQKVFG